MGYWLDPLDRWEFGRTQTAGRRNEDKKVGGYFLESPDSSGNYEQGRNRIKKKRGKKESTGNST